MDAIIFCWACLLLLQTHRPLDLWLTLSRIPLATVMGTSDGALTSALLI